MGNRFAPLFEPFKIGPLEVKNRIALAPMGNGGMVSFEGAFTENAIEYFVEIAKGGTGLILTGIVKVENEIEKVLMPSLPCISMNPGAFLKSASVMTERVHAYGSKIFMQLTAGFGRVGMSGYVSGTPVAPSPVPNFWNPAVTCRALTTAEVETLVERFGAAAHIARLCGFDGVEIHAVHEGYLLDQFAIGLFNQRTDRYGGDLTGRLRFPTEIVKVIKKAAGADYPVSLRYSIKSYIKDWRQGGLPEETFAEKGRDTEEGLQAAKILEGAGYDAFNADAGTYDAWYWAHPPNYQKYGCYLHLTEKLKKAVRVPVVVAGRMDDPEVALRALTENRADVVGIGRGLLADPYWPKKVMAGKLDRIRPCLACHDGCLQRLATGKALSCSVNPAAGREREYSIQAAHDRKTVMVVGGGVAGMEAARVCALRGHEVILYEKSDQLGGHLIAGAVPDFKAGEKRLLEWYKNALKELGVAVVLNTAVDARFVEDMKPQAVFVATGSTAKIPPVPGMDKHPRVTTAEALLRGEKPPGDSVLVIGGGHVGCETALWMAREGRRVSIIEALGGLMAAGVPVPHPNHAMLVDLLYFHRVDIRTNSRLLEITKEGARVGTLQGEQRVTGDTIVLATGYAPENAIYRALGSTEPEIYLIGDAKEVRNIMHAVWGAYEVSRSI